MRLIIFAALLGWFIFGSPTKNVADWIWANEAAPWETVDAFYYPRRSDLTVWRSMLGLNSVEDCRAWVSEEAARNGDGGLAWGDYECAVGKLGARAGLTVYRATVR